MIQWMLVTWSLVPLPFPNPACTYGSSWFIYCWSLLEGFWALLCQHVKGALLCSSLNILWHCHSFGLSWKLNFSSAVATAEFSKFAGILSAALNSIIFHDFKKLSWDPITSISFVGSNASQGPLDFKPRMSGSRWSTTPSWLSVIKTFFYSSSVYSCHLFLISSASGRSMPFLLLCPTFHEMFVIFMEY